MKKYAVRNLRLCTKDCLCLYVCPTGATDTENSIIDTDKCNGCGICSEACPSGAISMVPFEYPPQQKKAERVTAAIERLAKNKADEEREALEIAGKTESATLKKIMKALARSSRLVAEDLMRECGYMLPQSSNSLSLVREFINERPTAAFPVKEAEEILYRIKPNDKVTEEGHYRCSVCFSEFDLGKDDEERCPMCHAEGDKLERI